MKLEFTMPEALTKWKFMGFAHDGTLRAGYLQDEVVTADLVSVCRAQGKDIRWHPESQIRLILGGSRWNRGNNERP